MELLPAYRKFHHELEPAYFLPFLSQRILRSNFNDILKIITTHVSYLIQFCLFLITFLNLVLSYNSLYTDPSLILEILI